MQEGVYLTKVHGISSRDLKYLEILKKNEKKE